MVEEKEAGVVLKVKDLSNQKEKQKVMPLSNVFLPFEKIDFMILL